MDFEAWMGFPGSQALPNLRIGARYASKQTWTCLHLAGEKEHFAAHKALTPAPWNFTYETERQMISLVER